MKKTILSAILILAVMLSFAACGGQQGNTFTCEDVVDSSATQQRWLKNPTATIVVNPDAIGNSDYKDTDGKLGLEIGVTNEKGKIVKTLDDVLFIVEPTWANAKGGEEVWVCNWTDDSVKILTRGWPEATSQTLEVKFDELVEWDEEGTQQRWAYADGESAHMQLWFYQHYHFMANYPVPTVADDVEYFLVVDCEISDKDRWNKSMTKSYPKVWSVRGYFDDSVPEEQVTYLGETGMYADLISYVKKVPGVYYVNIHEQAAKYTGAAASDFIYPTLFLEREGEYKFNKFAIVGVDKEVKAGEGNMNYTWTPYSITSYQEYNNDTALQTVDIITGPNAVTRQITGKRDGAAYYGGYLNGGTATAVTQMGAVNMTITVKGSDFEYTVAFGDQGTVEFYASESDMLNRENATTEPTADSQYWLFVPTAKVYLDATSYVGVSATVTGEDTITIASEAAMSRIFKKYSESLEASWDEYISKFDVSDYIVNIPEEE